MIKATLICGSEAVEHYKETNEVPDSERFEESGCIVLPKEFRSEEEFRAYVDALDEVDGIDDYLLVNRVETEDTNLDSRIKNLLKEGPLTSLYFVQAMEYFQKHIAEKTDEELRAMFCYLFAPGVIRANARFIHNRLNNLPDDHQ